jgi:serine/threonine protein phosphatase PrpC
MKIEAYAHTDVGRKREINEDRYLIDRGLGLYVVCDGMGGHAAGEVAAENTTRIVAEALRSDRADIERELATPGGHFKVVQLVVAAVRGTCQQIHAMANSIPEYAGMGTTLTLLLIAGEKAILAHVGDSRLYLLREGRLHQLTHDHTLSNEMIQTGRIEPGSETAIKFANVLTRSIGAQEAVDVDTLLFDIHSGDRLLLCSDGLSNYLNREEETIELLSGSDLDQLPSKLVTHANDCGGRDNIACITIDVVADGEAKSKGSRWHLEALDQTDLFGGLRMSQLMRILNVCDIRSYGPGEWIIRRGDRRDGMYVVVAGSCFVALPNRERVTRTRGDSFAETALACDDSSYLNVRTDEAVTLLHINRGQFGQLVRRLPKLGRVLLMRLACELGGQLDKFVAGADALNETGIWELDSDDEE